MQLTPVPAPSQDKSGRASGVMAASPHLLDALEALAAMTAADAELRTRLFSLQPCSATPTISASATTCKP